MARHPVPSFVASIRVTRTTNTTREASESFVEEQDTVFALRDSDHGIRDAIRCAQQLDSVSVVTA
jgi:hypothetical protein